MNHSMDEITGQKNVLRVTISGNEISSKEVECYGRAVNRE